MVLVVEFQTYFRNLTLKDMAKCRAVCQEEMDLIFPIIFDVINGVPKLPIYLRKSESAREPMAKEKKEIYAPSHN